MIEQIMAFALFRISFYPSLRIGKISRTIFIVIMKSVTVICPVILNLHQSVLDYVRFCALFALTKSPVRHPGVLIEVIHRLALAALKALFFHDFPKKARRH
ncbi:MAG: hypothetical protein IPN19_15305 [Elusimicrobia bacterium]|nr:hypothetical protein [Elusimicrobiota bacterium]